MTAAAPADMSTPAGAARELRRRALRLTAPEVGVVPGAGHQRVWGLLVETGFPEAVATLACFADGSTSLYFSNGGGVIGAGAHATVRTAADALISLADAWADAFQPASAHPLPGVGRVRFHVHGFDGLRSVEASEEELRRAEHPLAPLHAAAHAVVAAIRESSAGPAA